MSTVSHNTESMRNWSNNMDSNANDYDLLVNRLYSLVDEFAGSSRFSGGLSADFLDKVLSQKSSFLRYSSTFRECAEIISKRAARIDNDEAQLKNRINSANPLE